MAISTSRLTASDLPSFGELSAIADPAPLGLAAFALTTFVLSAVNAGLVPKSGEAVVLGLAAAYGGAAQFAAGMWEFRRNNTFGATAFTSYGAFWIAFALLVTLYLPSIPVAATPSAIGTFLLAWAIFTVYMSFAARHVSRPIFAVFVLLSAAFFALAIGAYLMLPAATKIGGYLGFATAATAWYASFLGVMSATAPTKGAK